MAGYLYSLTLKLLYPTSVALLCLGVAGLVSRRRPRWRWRAELLAAAVLVTCGNGWVVGAMIRQLEGRYAPPVPVPTADAILVLSGGVLGRMPPRPTVEVADAGDRLLYGALLFKQGKAPRIICTGNVATGGIAPRPASEDMADLLSLLGVPSQDVVTEVKSENTHEHVVQLCPQLQARGVRRVLLVTSAMHMPRAAGVFNRGCPAITFIPAPTDYRAPDDVPRPWHRQVHLLIPTPRSLLDFSDAAHEYLGIAYYTLRGWM
jgi:uncharacterized SAM-binding protein YcdF (DUF218 family)